MARPALALNSHGAITVRTLAATDPKKPKKYAARCRDGDGSTRLVERHGHSRTAALKNLQDSLEDRQAPKAQGLSQESRFREAATIWLDGKARKRSATSVKAYRTRLASILPELGELRLPEISVARLETFFDDLEDRGLSPNYRRSLRAAVSGIFQVAVKHRAISFNPVSALDDIEGGRKQPRGLTAEERRRLLDFLDSDGAARRRDLPDLARFMLGTVGSYRRGTGCPVVRPGAGWRPGSRRGQESHGPCRRRDSHHHTASRREVATDDGEDRGR
jgi:hypothetical protein